jgi:hypothetical protein
MYVTGPVKFWANSMPQLTRGQVPHGVNQIEGQWNRVIFGPATPITGEEYARLAQSATSYGMYYQELEHLGGGWTIFWGVKYGVAIRVVGYSPEVEVQYAYVGCRHTWSTVNDGRRCYTKATCTTCGMVEETDSSD